MIDILKLSDRFESYSFEEKKDIIHIIENALRANEFAIETKELNKFKFNKNILHRIIYYLVNEYNSQTNVQDDIKNMEIEYEKINAASKKKSLTALHYSIRLIKTKLKSNPAIVYRDESFVEILNFLEKNKNLDKGNQIKNNLKFIINAQHDSNPTIVEKDSNVFSEAKNLIRKGETFKAIRYLSDNYTPNSKELNQLSSRLSFARSNNLRGTLSYQTYTQERAKITDSLLDLIEIFENE